MPYTEVVSGAAGVWERGLGQGVLEYERPDLWRDAAVQGGGHLLIRLAPPQRLHAHGHILIVLINRTATESSSCSHLWNSWRRGRVNQRRMVRWRVAANEECANGNGALGREGISEGGGGLKTSRSADGG